MAWVDLKESAPHALRYAAALFPRFSGSVMSSESAIFFMKPRHALGAPERREKPFLFFTRSSYSDFASDSASRPEKLFPAFTSNNR